MQEDPLRQFHVDCYALEDRAEWFKDVTIDEINSQFLLDVVIATAILREKLKDRSSIKSAETCGKMLVDIEKEEAGEATNTV